MVHYYADREANHGFRASAVAPLAINWRENMTFVAKAGDNMLAVSHAGTLWIPSHVLRYHGARASEELCGMQVSAFTSPILPYENPGPSPELDLAAPSERAFLLFFPEPE